MAADPLTDTRALLLGASAPDEVSAVGQHFTQLSLDGGDIVSALTGADSSDWTGEAADTYRRWIHKLPTQLSQLGDRLWDTGTGISTYAADLSEQAPRFARLAAQLRDARSTLTTATQRLSTAQDRASSASTAALTGHATDVTGALARAADAAEREQLAASSAHRTASHEVDSLTRQCFAVLDDFDHSRHRAASLIKDQIQRFDTNLEVLPPTTAYLFLTGLATTVGHAFRDLPGDVVQAQLHPFDLSKLSKEADDIGTIVATVGFAAAIVAAPLDGPEVAALAAVSDIADVAFDGALAVKTGADVGRVAEGQADVDELEADGETILLDGAGKIAVRNREAAVAALKPYDDAATKLRTALSKYANPTKAEVDEALGELPLQDRIKLQTQINRHGVDLSDAKARTIFLEGINSAYATAQRYSKTFGDVNRAIQYGGGDAIGSHKEISKERRAHDREVRDRAGTGAPGDR